MTENISMVQIYNALSVHDFTSIFREENYDLAPNRYVITTNEENINESKPLVQLEFQNGEIKDGINGIMIENLLAISKDRLEHFQKTKFACEENKKAIDAIEYALMILKKRADDRKLLGIYSTHKLEGE